MSQFRDTEFYEVLQARGSGPRFQVAPDGHRVLRDYLVRGDPDRVRQAIRDFLGSSSIRTVGGVKYISRDLPHSIAEYTRPSDERRFLWASGVSVIESYTQDPADDVPAGGFLPSYRLAKLQLSYTAYRYSLRPDEEVFNNDLDQVPDEGRLLRFVSKFVKPFARVVTLTRRLMRFVAEAGDAGAGQEPVTEGQAIHEPGEDLTYVHHLRPDYPRGRLAAALGHVNSTTFDGYPAGTLLCEPAEATPIVLPSGDPGYDITFRFKYLPRKARVTPFTERGWNWIPKYLTNDGGRWDYRRVTSDGTAGGTPPYPSADFHDLFRPDQ